MVSIVRALVTGMPSASQPESLGARHAADGAQQLVEFDAHFLSLVLADQHLLPGLDQELLRLVVDQDLDAFGAEPVHHHGRNLRILAHQDAGQHFDLRDPGAEPREGLRQLRADRAAAQHDQAARQRAELPHVLRGQAVHVLDAGNRRNERARASGDHD